MFNKLVASDHKRRGRFGTRAMTVSVVVHGLLLAGAVYASVLSPRGGVRARPCTRSSIQQGAPCCR